MTKKKKPSAVQPTLKLSLAPKDAKKDAKPYSVSIFLDVAKRDFHCQFGFDEFRAPSIPQLEAKLKQAIAKGATPEPVWVPMIEMSLESKNDRPNYEESLDWSLDLGIERQYYCIGKGRELLTCGWEVKPPRRNKEASEAYGAFAGKWLNGGSHGPTPVKTLDEPTFIAGHDHWGQGPSIEALIPYTEALWKELQTLVTSLRGDAKSLIEATKRGTLDALQSLALNFKRNAPKAQNARAAALNVNRHDKKPKSPVPARRGSLEPMTGKPRKKTLSPSDKKQIVEMKKRWDERKASTLAASEKKDRAGKHQTASTTAGVKEICICVPRVRADQQRINPYCKFPHVDSKARRAGITEPTPSPGPPARAAVARGGVESGVGKKGNNSSSGGAAQLTGSGVGKLDPSITAEFRKALNLKLLKGLLESDEFGVYLPVKSKPRSNDEIMELLRSAFREGGTIEVTLPDDGPQLPSHLCQVTCKGGPGPAVWFKANADGKPDLKGKDLIAAVRKVMEIPCPLEHIHGKAKKKPADGNPPTISFREIEHYLHEGPVSFCFQALKGLHPDLQNVYFKRGKVQLVIGLLGECKYLTPAELQSTLNGINTSPHLGGEAAGKAPSPTQPNKQGGASAAPGAAVSSAAAPANGNSILPELRKEQLSLLSKEAVLEELKALPASARHMCVAVAASYLPASQIHNGKLDWALVEALGFPQSTSIEVNWQNVHVRGAGNVTLIRSREWLNELIEAVAAAGEEKNGTKAASGETKKAKGETKQATNGTPNGYRPRKSSRIPDGPLSPEQVKLLGYPEGTVINVSRKMGNAKDRMGNVEVQPPGHVAERYSIGWLEDRLKKAEIARMEEGVDWAEVRKAEKAGKELEDL